MEAKSDVSGVDVFRTKSRSTAMSKNQARPNAALSDYNPTPEERAALQTVANRHVAAAPTPRLKIREDQISVDHPDRFTGDMLLMRAIGTIDFQFQEWHSGTTGRCQPAGIRGVRT
jgi:hypothetical protein